MECSEQGCTDPAAVRLHIPWEENRVVCAAHARGMAQADGIVAEPIEADGEGGGADGQP
jgi:hypothetical protein